MTLAVIARSEATKQSISPQKESKKDGLLRFACNDGGRPGGQMTLAAVIARSEATKQSISPQKESKKDGLLRFACNDGKNRRSIS
jgi:hypothetical protein